MRELGAVIRTRFPLFGNVWMATTYDAVNELLRDHHQFVQNPATAGNRWMGTILRCCREHFSRSQATCSFATSRITAVSAA